MLLDDHDQGGVHVSMVNDTSVETTPIAAPDVTVVVPTSEPSPPQSLSSSSPSSSSSSLSSSSSAVLDVLCGVKSDDDVAVITLFALFERRDPSEIRRLAARSRDAN